MMELITPAFLVELIVFEIDEQIGIHRESKGHYSVYGDEWAVTDTEVETFIRSTPFYGERLKEILLDKEDESFSVTQEWIMEFREKTTEWAESDEWLYDDIHCMINPSMNESIDRVPLEIPE